MPGEELSHVDEGGTVRMVDVGGKPLLRRRARATAVVRMGPGQWSDCGVAERRRPDDGPVAGIMAAKRTAELIPLCHPLPLAHVDVRPRPRTTALRSTASVETTAQTGVEMEALTAAAVAALTVYDMVKGVDKEMVVEDVRLRREDEGGRR